MSTPYQFNEYQEAWLRDLETTTAKQGPGFLRIEYDGVVAYCCLGRAEVAVDGHEPEATSVHLTRDLSDKLKLRTTWGHLFGPVTKNTRVFHSLDAMNDSGDWTFAEIAEFIRANPGKVFEDASPNG
jgi:hypothetical protein